MKFKLYIMGLFILVCSLSRATIEIKLPTINDVKIGSEINVPVLLLGEISPSSISSFQLHISFGNNQLTFMGVETEQTLSKGFSVTANASEQYLQVAAAGNQTYSEGDTLIFLKFKAMAAGYSYFQFRDLEKRNFLNEGIPTLNHTNGWLRVLPLTVISTSPNGYELAIGERIRCSSWSGTAPYTYSSSDMSIAQFEINELVGLKRGSVNINVTDINLNTGTTVNPFVVRSFKTGVRDTSYYQNNKIKIPILFSNLDATPVFSGNYEIELNASILSLDSIKAPSGILPSQGQVNFSQNGNKVQISFASAVSFTASGNLFDMYCTIADVNSGATSITFKSGTINENLKPKMYNGYFRINALPNIYISPSPTDIITGETQTFTTTYGESPYKWSVDNPTIASIDENTGLLTALKGGEVKVQVKDINGAKGETRAFTVYDTWAKIKTEGLAVIGKKADIAFEIGSIGSNNIQSISGKVKYTDALIDSVKILPSPTHTDGWIAVNNEIEKLNRFALTGAQGFNTSGDFMLLRIYFKDGISIGSKFSIQLDELLFNEGSPSAKLSDGQVTINSISTLVDSPIIFPFQLFPNPSKGQFTLKGDKITHVELYDLTGKRILNMYTGNTQHFSTELNSVKPGIYIIRVNKSFAQKWTLIQ